MSDTSKMLEAFVGTPEKMQWYKEAFSQYNVNGVDRIAWVWSWWAFFGGAFFLLYRKAYIPAAVLFGITTFFGIIPTANPIAGIFLSICVSICQGGFATYFIYKTFIEKKELVKNTVESEEKQIETMRQIGGVNTWVIVVCKVLAAVFFLLVFLSVVATGIFR